MSYSRMAMRRAVLALALVVFLIAGGLRLESQNASGKTAPAPPPPAFKPTPEQLAIQAASEKEHQREMDLLGIKELRHGADGDPKSPNAANYDESKADVYPNLPDPLLLAERQAGNNGEDVVDQAPPADCRAVRRGHPGENARATAQGDLGSGEHEA